MAEDNFEFYGEGTDDMGKIERKGITGDVTDYTFTGMQYPCIVFNPDFHCPKHKLNVIKNMVESSTGNKDISLYFVNNNELFKIGMLDGLQVNFFLEVVGNENVTGYFDEKTKLLNSMIYTLSTMG